MIIICPNFYELNLISFGNLNANVSQLIIDSLREDHPPIFCRANQMIQ